MLDFACHTGKARMYEQNLNFPFNKHTPTSSLLINTAHGKRTTQVAITEGMRSSIQIIFLHTESFGSKYVRLNRRYLRKETL